MSSWLTRVSLDINSRSPFTRLLICAAISALIYLIIFTLPFPLTGLYNTIPPVDYTKLTNYSATGLWRYLGGIAVLFGLYIWAIRLTIPPTLKTATASHPSRFTLHLIFISSAIFGIILIFSYPLTAIDLFIYTIRTRGWALYALQPLATPPEALPTTDPWLGLAGEWVDAASPYGPLWEGLSLVGFYVSGGAFLPHLFALKIISALAYLGCAWLVYKILTHLHSKWAVAGTLAFAWNPLVLFESVQNGHNDIVMVFFLLAAIWIFIKIDKPPSAPLSLLVCLLLALSILVKFVTLIIAPFFLLALAMRQATWLRRTLWLAGYGLVTLAIVVGMMLPFWPGWKNWAVLEAGSQAGRSLLALLVVGLRDSMGTNTAFDVSRNLILAIFALLYLRYLWRVFKNSASQSPTFPIPIPKKHPPRAGTVQNGHRRAQEGHNLSILPISASFHILFWYVLLVAPVFHAWYLLWFLPLASMLLPQRPPLIGAIVFSITALLVIPYFETIRVWYPLLLQNHFLGHLIGVPLLILPPAVTLLWTIRSSPNSEV